MDQLITCGAAVERLWAFLDHELDDDDLRAVEAHLAFCMRCCGELEFAKHLRSLLAQHGTGGTGGTGEVLPTEVRARLDQFIDQLAETAGAAGAAETAGAIETAPEGGGAP
jgi:anti-sigma factor (TIGR02949 family)